MYQTTSSLPSYPSSLLKIEKKLGKATSFNCLFFWAAVIQYGSFVILLEHNKIRRINWSSFLCQ
jgi:hypothetical protein